MFVKPEQLLRSLLNELSVHFAQDRGEASVGQSATSAIRLLAVDQHDGAAMGPRRRKALDALIDELKSDASPALAVRLASVGGAVDGQPPTRETIATTLAALETVIADDAVTADLPEAARMELLRKLAAWEVADRRALIDLDSDPDAIDIEVTRERFETYLRDRFAEPELSVTEFRPLSGGFGKQTILLSVSGTAIDGPLVIRRDPVVPTVDNDCHRVAIEYPVIRAAFDRGFPAPDALWIDTEHRLLPGPDFLVMRMAAGKTGGNVFHSTEVLSDSLVEVLASGVAGLHTLPPLTELGDLTNSIRTDLWSLSMAETTRRYITDWRSYFMAHAHNPSPTLMALYRWMLANVPEAPDRPVLVHGDIGFHNMLIDNGQLTALVDWEFAHIGDPAEDLGSIRNALGAERWDAIMEKYRAGGGPDIEPARLHFFRIWQHVRNASASNLSMGKFQTGEIPDLKLAYTGHYHFPLFIQAAWDLIEAGPEGTAPTVNY
ncbi:MAG: phosphotransferase [Sphingomonadales bacterium]|nr:phosphotransferase [Sphingomonadales bacterium]